MEPKFIVGTGTATGRWINDEGIGRVRAFDKLPFGKVGVYTTPRNTKWFGANIDPGV